jgi:hypothetical protein
VTALEAWASALVSVAGTDAVLKVTATPGKHVPPGPAGLLAAANDLLGAVPPTNGWMLELGRAGADASVPPTVGYTIYISGDTLLVDELNAIPERFPKVDLMLAHLGGTTIPGARAAAHGDDGRRAGRAARAPRPARRHHPDPLRRLRCAHASGTRAYPRLIGAQTCSSARSRTSRTRWRRRASASASCTSTAATRTSLPCAGERRSAVGSRRGCTSSVCAAI